MCLCYTCDWHLFGVHKAWHSAGHGVNVELIPTLHHELSHGLPATRLHSVVATVFSAYLVNDQKVLPAVLLETVLEGLVPG